MTKRFLASSVLPALLSLIAIGSGCDTHLLIGVGGGSGGGGGAPGTDTGSRGTGATAPTGGDTTTSASSGVTTSTGGGATMSTGSGTTTSTSGGTPGDCPSLPGPAMVRIPAPPGGVSYCIDTTEVTQAQYAAFLASGPLPDPSSALCGYKSTFQPGHELGDQNTQEGSPTECHPTSTFYNPSATPSLPVVCVDWCDATAYCAWAGKHLCGRIGGGPATENDYDDATTDEWERACSSAGLSQWPYGSTFQHGTCVDGDTVEPVGSASGCHGQGAPYDQIFDMSGNVVEWENLCVPDPFNDPDAGQTLPMCMLRGGSVGDFNPYISISGQRFGCFPLNGGIEFDALNFERPHTGIRCCAD